MHDAMLEDGFPRREADVTSRQLGIMWIALRDPFLSDPSGGTKSLKQGQISLRPLRQSLGSGLWFINWRLISYPRLTVRANVMMMLCNAWGQETSPSAVKQELHDVPLPLPDAHPGVRREPEGDSRTGDEG